MINRISKDKIFGQKLRQIMNDRNISANELAKSIDIDRANISKYLNGDSSPKLNTFFSICSYFNVEPNYFFEVDGEVSLPSSSKSESAKIIESLFIIMDSNILEKGDESWDSNYYSTKFVGYPINELCDDCYRYAKTDLFDRDDVCKRLIDKYEKRIEFMFKREEISKKHKKKV